MKIDENISTHLYSIPLDRKTLSIKIINYIDRCEIHFPNSRATLIRQNGKLSEQFSYENTEAKDKFEKEWEQIPEEDKKGLLEIIQKQHQT